jgi:Fe-S-cluster-containing hydrogenase component 2
MKRKIVKIDEEKCIGCGLCAQACHEGAIQMVDGKAKLISDSYCDGLGACLPACPADAIEIIEREADAFDEAYAKAHQEKKMEEKAEKLACGCPGTASKTIQREEKAAAPVQAMASQLRQWPCQIKLVPANAPYLNNANLLVAADCTAYAYANIHNEFMRNKITLIGCPKLDAVDYAEKLTEILRQNEIKSITVLRMEVPCCGGIVNAVKQAILNSGKMLPWHVVTISTDGEILED